MVILFVTIRQYYNLLRKPLTMINLKEKINSIAELFHNHLKQAATDADLEKIRIDFLGRSGHLVTLMSMLKELSLEEKKEFGPALNQLKQSLQEAFDLRKKELEAALTNQAQQQEKHFDVTAYKPSMPHGSLHIYTQIQEQLENIFISMGFQVVDGPEVETDYYNFEALNIPSNHPARDLQDTFWLTTPGMLLRTHTSNVQAHAMETMKLPLAIFAPGRCYRNEATDATHEFMFTQGECLVIDKDISIANLLATAKTFLQHFFNKPDLKIRVRPGYFPFVEPGLEIDASCPFCTKGCSVCKKTTWIELLGSGLIHPNVLRANGIDPEIYTGFAFGFGIERLAMVKHKITDIRLFHSSKIGFLEQF